MNAYTSLNETWYVYHATLGHLKGTFHISLPSVIPTLEPPKLYSFVDFIMHFLSDFPVRYSNYGEREGALLCSVTIYCNMDTPYICHFCFMACFSSSSGICLHIGISVFLVICNTFIYKKVCSPLRLNING
jgi:hypothetical protein